MLKVGLSSQDEKEIMEKTIPQFSQWRLVIKIQFKDQQLHTNVVPSLSLQFTVSLLDTVASLLLLKQLVGISQWVCLHATQTICPLLKTHHIISRYRPRTQVRTSRINQSSVNGSFKMTFFSSLPRYAVGWVTSTQATVQASLIIYQLQCWQKCYITHSSILETGNYSRKQNRRS